MSAKPYFLQDGKMIATLSNEMIMKAASKASYINILGEEVSVSEARKKAQQTNPVIRVFGEGPAGEKCKNCKHLFDKSFSKKYYKCALRSNNQSPKTDHRVYYDACGKFERKD